MTGNNSSLNLAPGKNAVNADRINKAQYLSASYKQFVVLISKSYALFLAERAFVLSIGDAFSNKVS